jgi:hypothetical protein
MRINVTYEQKFKLNSITAYNLSLQWLSTQYKSKIKITKPPNFVEAKQGTMMTNTGYDPNWKKRIKISLFEIDKDNTLVRIDANPLSRNILRVEKLKKSWFEGLFKYLFSTLQATEKTTEIDVHNDYKEMVDFQMSNCSNCGESIEKTARICPYCGIMLKL